MISITTSLRDSSLTLSHLTILSPSMGINGDRKHHDQAPKGIPEGYMAVMVGHEAEEQLQRFVIPVLYLNHPLFMNLLKEAEEEYGFEHKGPITIPCHVDHFRAVQFLVAQEYHHRSPLHRHPQDHFLCFKTR